MVKDTPTLTPPHTKTSAYTGTYNKTKTPPEYIHT